MLLLLLPMLFRGSLTCGWRFQLEVQSSVMVQEGLCILVPCNVSYPEVGWTDSDPAHGYWFQKGTDTNVGAPVTSNNPDQEVRRDTQGRFQLLGDSQKGSCSLVIRDAQREDTATYFFRVQRGSYVKFNVTEYTLSLEVAGLTQKPNVYVPENLEPGCPATLFCVFPGDFEGCMASRFSWMGAAVTPQGDGPQAFLFSALTLILRPQDHDSELTCRVDFSRNAVNTSRTIRLRTPGPMADVVLVAIMVVVLKALILCLYLTLTIVRCSRKRMAGPPVGLEDTGAKDANMYMG